MNIPGTPPNKSLQAGFLAWLVMLGIDFFLHAGLLAGFYRRDSPFLLPPETAFRLIPVGYLSFLLLAWLLIWLMRRMRIAGAMAGLFFGLQLGLLAWGALVVGLASIATADLDLLLGWWLGQSLELGAAGMVAGIVFERDKLGKLTLGVLGLVVLMFVLTVLLQSFGLV